MKWIRLDRNFCEFLVNLKCTSWIFITGLSRKNQIHHWATIVKFGLAIFSCKSSFNLPKLYRLHGKKAMQSTTTNQLHKATTRKLFDQSKVMEIIYFFIYWTEVNFISWLRPLSIKVFLFLIYFPFV